MSDKTDKNFLDKALDTAEDFMDKMEARHEPPDYVEAQLQQWWRAVRSEIPQFGLVKLGPIVWHAFQKDEPLCGIVYAESTDLILSDVGGQILVCQSCLYRSGAR